MRCLYPRSRGRAGYPFLHGLDLGCGVKPSCPHTSNEHSLPSQKEADRAERLRRYEAGRVIEFLSVCPEFEDLQENNFLEMNFTDLTEFFVMKLGYESIEECYERFVYREPYGLAAFNAEVERLRLGAIAGGKESHDAILKHLAAFKT
jgi:hypothetical protein